MDTSSSMYFPEAPSTRNAPHVNKLTFSTLAAATLMNLLKKQRDAFGLSTFASDLDKHTAAKSSTRHYNLIMAHLEQLLNNPVRDKTTSIAPSLHKIAEATHKRSLVVIFSDMFQNGQESEEIFAALQHLKYNKHEVILFHVVDKRYEMDFEFENRPYIFVDIESGEKVRVQPNQVKDFYVEQVQKYKQQLQMKCLQYKIDFVEADINKGFRQILLPYLVKRSKMG
jgi:uncharacterized protein (DUF58 family)